MSDIKKEDQLLEDLIFISHESVRDTSKAAEGTVIRDEHVSEKKTKRRSVDAEAAKKERAKKIARKNLHFIILGAVVVIVVLALLVAGIRTIAAKRAAANKEQPLSSQEYETDAYTEINELIVAYYDCYAAGDTDTILQYAYPMSDTERSYIEMYAGFVEEYENIVCYTKTGADENSYIVSVAFDVKYTGIGETAPGMDFFYVVFTDDETVHIDNTYSPFNLLYQEYSLDQTILQLIATYEESDDVISLQASVQTRYEAAVAESETLAEMVDVTIAEAVAAWLEEYEAVLAQKAAEAAAQVAAETAEDEEAEEEVVEEETSSKKKKSSSSSSSSSNITTSNAWMYVSEGSTITLTSSVNVRVSMSESADRIGLAYAGEKIYVIQNYSEGWTKVTWNGETGYVRTDVLAQQ